MARTGETLADRYVVGDPIGQGRSTVYRAEDTRLRRQVAVKEVKLWASQEDARRVRLRALREAQAAARLTNPGVVTVFDVVEQAGSIWLVMELVDAPSLSALVTEGGPLDHRRAARIGLDVLDALHAAHTVGIVHRDVKPANVLVVANQTKLTDFGVATIRDESRLTSIGTIVGSPSYMAPEQARGEQVGPGADLWALGAMLYFAVEGRAAFEGDSPIATASAVVHADPRPQQRPGPLSGIIARLLVKDPAQRPDVPAIQAALAEVAEPERPPGPPEPAEDGPTLVGAPLFVPAEPGDATAPAAAVADDADEGEDGDAGERADAPVTEESAAATPAAAAAAPAPAREPPAPARPEPGRGLAGGAARQAAVATVVLVAVGGVAAASLWLGGNDGEGGDGTRPTTTATSATTEVSAAADDGTAPEPEPEPGPGPGPSSTTAAPADEPEPPDGWTRFTDPTAGAYTIAHPAGWQVQRRTDTRIDFRDPGSGSYLRVEWVQPPTSNDPAAVWRANAGSFAARHEGYQELGIRPVEYRDYTAALWEFRYTDGGVRLHAANLGFIAEGRGYALFFQTREQDWAASQDVLQQFRRTFQPAPAG